MLFGAPVLPSAGVSASSCASPSVSRMSGEKVNRASRAPTEAIFVIGLIMISPASLNNSAQAIAQTSARVLFSPLISMPPPRNAALPPDSRQVGLDELLPAVVRRGGLGVVSLELFVAAVIRC